MIWKPRRRSQRIAPAVPEGVRIYAIGDIHGRADLLGDLFARIDADRASFPLEKTIHVFLGDYVDRGPHSRLVLDLLIERGRTYPSVYLKGNHESFVVEFMENPAVLTNWRLFGGLDTILSYDLAPSLSPNDSRVHRAGILISIKPCRRSIAASSKAWRYRLAVVTSTLCTLE